MAHPQELSPKIVFSDVETAGLSIIKNLVPLCARLRHAVSANQASSREQTLRDVLTALDDLLTGWSSHNIPLDEVITAIGRCREGLSSLLTHKLEHPQFPASLYHEYLLLDNIASQMTAAIEQSRLEQGVVPTRQTLLNRLIDVTSAKRYLEIGCCNNDCFNSIICPHKVGVDPCSGGTLRMTSDAFFEVNSQTFDLIFIDGLHESWQVDKDIRNALQWSSPNALIVLHDCNPLFEVRALVPRVAETWNGDVWKSLVRIRSRGDLDCATGLFDHGCAVIVKRPNSAPIEAVPEGALRWENLVAHRQSWLRLMSYSDLLQWIHHPTGR